MKKIFKYQIAPTVKMPKGAKVIRVAQQDGIGFLWAIVNPAKTTSELRKFGIVGTGHVLPEKADYIGSYDDGPFVWHVLEF